MVKRIGVGGLTMVESHVIVQSECAKLRKDQLLEIMQDAVVHVLERHIDRRGPYVIHDSDLRPSVSLMSQIRL